MSTNSQSALLLQKQLKGNKMEFNLTRHKATYSSRIEILPLTHSQKAKVITL